MKVTDITKTNFPPARILGPADLQAGTGKLAPRSPGLHVSDIYRDLERTIEQQEKSKMTEKELAFYAAGGFLWEHVFSQAMADSFRYGDIIRPGEFEADGVIGSPDNWHIPTGRVVETKCTWRSARKADHLEKFFWTWLVQLQGYCRLLGTLEAELYIFWVCGDYAPPVPFVQAFLLQWGQREIDDNWAMILNHARRRGWLVK